MVYLLRFKPDFLSNDQFEKISGFKGDKIRSDIKAIMPNDPIDALFKRFSLHWVNILYNKIFDIEITFKCIEYYYATGFSDSTDDPLDQMPDEEFIIKHMFDYFIQYGLYLLQSAKKDNRDVPFLSLFDN